MNKILCAGKRRFTIGLLTAGMWVGVVYGQTPAGQAPPPPTPNAATTPQSGSPDKVVLKVGDVSVTQTELTGIINSLNPQAQKSLSQQGRRPLGDQVVIEILLSQNAVSHHLDSTSAFQETLARTKRELLAQAEFDEIARKATVTPEEAGKYFAGHSSEFEEVMVRQVVIRKKPEGAKEGTLGLSDQEAKTRADEIRKALGSGDDPKKVAEKFQVPNVVRITPDPTPLRRGSARPDMEKAAFELKDGQVSDAFDYPQALVLLQVVSHHTPELKDVLPQIENTLKQQKIQSTIAELKKGAKIWMDDDYFTSPNKPTLHLQDAVKPEATTPATK